MDKKDKTKDLFPEEDEEENIIEKVRHLTKSLENFVEALKKSEFCDTSQKKENSDKTLLNSAACSERADE